MAYNQLDIYHRAFRAYKNELDAYFHENKLHKAICHAPISKEYLETTRFRCSVRIDWIEAIEKALPFIERAIMEGRQFILQQGDVQLIEKVRRVSKTSVEHLSKHSELITHLPAEGEDVLPDKLYVAENDSNFAVYENRFLYLLLLTLDDFVNNKYAKIIELWNKYESKLEFSKSVFVGKRKIEFTLSLKEDSQNDADTAYDEEAGTVIARIGSIQRSVTMLLQTSLMKELSHVTLLKPPITRTNVLKMDNNFKVAVELYDFISAYQDDGYVVQRIGEKLDRFTDLMEADFAELIAQSSYLTYRYGGKLDQLMEQRYQNQNKKVRENEDRAAREALEALKKRLESGEVSVEQYVKFLEERNAVLEKERERANQVENEVGQLRQELYLAVESNENLQDAVGELKREIQEKETLIEENEAKHKAELEEQRATFEREIAELRCRLEESEELYLAAMAQLHGLRHQYGLIPENEEYSSKEMLLVLEKEKNAFEKFFTVQWKKAKKQIRSNVFRKNGRNESSSENTTEIDGEKKGE